jgi:hypothetical protein
MVMAPRIPEEDVRQGRRNALRHPLERRRILKACKRAMGTPLLPASRLRRILAQVRLFRGRVRMFWTADVLLWHDRAFVRGVGYFDARRDANGTWQAIQMTF